MLNKGSDTNVLPVPINPTTIPASEPVKNINKKKQHFTNDQVFNTEIEFN